MEEMMFPASEGMSLNLLPRALDFGTGLLQDALISDANADKAWKRQKKVLQNQVQWRVEDAIKAGLHPLAALGMNPADGPAASVGGDVGFRGMGASSSVTLPGDPAQRAAELIEQQLRNDLLRAQIGEIRSRSAGNVASAGAIGKTMVKDMDFTNKTQGAWGDFIASILGTMRFFEDSWRTGMAKQPVVWPKVGKVGPGLNLGVPKGYVGRR